MTGTVIPFAAPLQGLANAPEYFAVLDPRDPERMTYWRRVRGDLKPWAPRARYVPLPLRSDVPTDPEARRTFVLDWTERVIVPWNAAVRAAIDGDPLGCAARFAVLKSKCCICGRPLRDPLSKTAGIGPDCQEGWPPRALLAMCEAVGRAHAAAFPDWRPGPDLILNGETT